MIDGEGEASELPLSVRGTSEALGSETPTDGSGAGEEAVVGDGRRSAGRHASTTTGSWGKTQTASNYGADPRIQTPPAVEALETGPVESVAPARRDADGHAQARRRARRTTTSSAAPAKRTGAAAPNRRAKSRGHGSKGRKAAESARNRHRGSVARTRSTTTGSSRKTSYGTTLRRGSDVHDLGPAADQLRTDDGDRPRRRDDPREDRPRRARHELPLRIRRNDRVWHRSARRAGRASARARAPVAVSATLTGLKIGVDLPLPRGRRQRSRAPRPVPDQTFTTVAAGAGRRDLRHRQ